MGGDAHGVRGDGSYRPVLARGDGHMLYLMARSTALDLDWKFDNDLARFGDPWKEPVTATGRKSIVHPIGPALVWTPLIWIAQLGAMVTNALGASIPLHGYTLWHQRFVFLSSVLFACGAVFVSRKVAQFIVGGTWSATYSAVSVLLGTSLTYYATYMPSYAHAMDAFACSAFLGYWSLTIGRRDVRRWLALGALLGAATLIRVQELALGVVVVVEVAVRIVQVVRDERTARTANAMRWLVGGALTLGVAVLVFLPQVLEWHLVFGNAMELPQGMRYTRWNAPLIPELLFSARNGWFVCTPIAYISCIGLLWLARKPSVFGWAMVAVVGVQIYLNSTILDWWSSSSFGQRRLCNMTLPLVIGLAYALHRASAIASMRLRASARYRHVCAIFAVGILVTWNVGRVSQFAGGKPAPDALVPTCCDRIAAPLRPIAQWLYDRIGNPFEFPANAAFAIRHRVPLSRWDQTVGAYPLQPRFAELRDDNRFYAQRGIWSIGAPLLAPYLISGWSPSQPPVAGRSFRFTTAERAVVLVPNLLPDPQRMTLWLASAGGGRVVVKWNGELVASSTIGASWTAVSFALDNVGVGTNELSLESDVAPMAARDGWPALQQSVGVAVSDLTIELQARETE